MKHQMNRNTRNWLLVTVILVVVLVVAVLAVFLARSTFWLPLSPFRHRLPPPGYIPVPDDIELFYTVEAVVSTINVTLSIFLLFIYVSIYRKTRSEFTIGLTIFSAVFLLNALASNPFIRGAFGFIPFGLGPFAMLPDLFTFAALAVLLYLSVRY